ncbi:putative NAD-binding of NADP-dependent 3-hydroxyisobutyrate dehydrogenase [Lyophyllum shimeji]|uniref:3-hydroxyisobutyrate dehydrogenase n=1 Tax=Lyophyllum shimeji TaxID=47721 RepID=A0A9P3UJG7_LYOSH|nr:putative NAD-binding of NADP-dependent 3-hydroxyisobutyrate dehydrogenase [Lyophyllum shimeji]
MSLTFPQSFGWVGLGAMGYPMAVQLRLKIPQTSKLCIYDVNEAVLHQFVKDMGDHGPIAIASNAREVAEQSEFIISIVPEGTHVRNVYLEPGVGLLAAEDMSGKIFVDCSTIDPATSIAVGNAVAASTPPSKPVARFYDAPVSGGTAGASKAILTFMVGASPSDPDFPLLKEVFSYMGTSIHALGGPSLGLAAKLSNNYLSGMIALATAEAMNLGMRLGLDPKVLSDCFATSSGGSWVNSTVNPVPGVCPDAVTSKGYEGGFKVQLMKKDILLAMEAAQQVDAKLVLGDAGLSAYSAAAADPRCRDKDSRVIYRWLGGIEPDVDK